MLSPQTGHLVIWTSRGTSNLLSQPGQMTGLFSCGSSGGGGVPSRASPAGSGGSIGSGGSSGASATCPLLCRRPLRPAAPSVTSTNSTNWTSSASLVFTAMSASSTTSTTSSSSSTVPDASTLLRPLIHLSPLAESVVRMTAHRSRIVMANPPSRMLKFCSSRPRVCLS